VLQADLTICQEGEGEKKINAIEGQNLNNNLKISNNSNETQAMANNNNNKVINNSTMKNDDNKNVKVEEQENTSTLYIKSRFVSAYSKYINNNKTLSSVKSKSKSIDKKEREKEKENEIKNINLNNEIFHPLIHFTNLTDTKLKLLGPFTNTKAPDNNKNV